MVDLRHISEAHAQMAAEPTPTRLSQMIAAALSKPGVVKTRVGKEIGVSHATINYWASGKTKPDWHRIPKIASVLDLDPTELLAAFNDAMMGDPAPMKVSANLLAEPSNVTPARAADPSRGPNDIPVYGVAAGGVDAEFYMNGEVSGFVKRPAAIAGLRDVYALHIIGDSMSPRFRDGDLVYVQKRTPQIGDDVVVQLHPTDGASAPRGFLKYLVRRSASSVICGQYNPPLEIDYDREMVVSIDRVIPWKELLGA